MAASAPVSDILADDASSDYGSDCDAEDEQLVNDLLAGLERRETLVLEDIVEHAHSTCSAHVPVQLLSQPTNPEDYVPGTGEQRDSWPEVKDVYDERAVPTHSTCTLTL